MITFLIAIIIWQYNLLRSKPRDIKVIQKEDPKPIIKKVKVKPILPDAKGWIPYTERFYIELPYKIKDPFLKDINWSNGTPSTRKRKSKLWNHELNVHGIVTCSYCNKLLTFESFTVDHIIPRSISRDHSLENLTPACDECNNKKGNKILKK